MAGGLDVNKLPRWVLIWGMVGFMTLGGVALRGAFADLSQTKARSMKNEQSISNLTQMVERIDTRQASFETKYDRNQEENQRVFRQILQAVRQ